MTKILKINKNNTIETILQTTHNKPENTKIKITRLPANIEYQIKNQQITTTTTKTLIHTHINILQEKTKHTLQPLHLIIIRNTDYNPHEKINKIEENIMITTHITTKSDANKTLNMIIRNIN